MEHIFSFEVKSVDEKQKPGPERFTRRTPL